MFNTLKYAKILEEVGFSREQAETSVKILVEIMEDKLASKQDIKDLALATKQDIKDLALATKQDFNDLSISTKQDIKDLENKLEYSINQVKSELTIRMGTMLAASIAIITALNKLF